MSKRKPYSPDMPLNWWLKNLFYTKYMIREGSSLVIAIYSFILLFGLLRLSQGSEAWSGWLEALTHPGAIVFHLVALVWALYHTVTWFALAPKASEVFIGTEKLADSIIMAVLWLGFVVVSLAVFLIVVL